MKDLENARKLGENKIIDYQYWVSLKDMNEILYQLLHAKTKNDFEFVQTRLARDILSMEVK